MAWTQTDLDRIEAAIASGVLTVRFADGRMVTYASMPDLLAVRTAMAGALNAAQASPIDRRTFIEFAR